MAAMSHNCRMAEEHQYWKEFQSHRHRFFKIMIADFRNRLRIPKKFLINFRENLSETIHLRGPSGFLWTVELERTSDQTVLLKGWDKFVKEHGLQAADFLVFQYAGRSTFNVVILDASGCEREGSYFVRKHTMACSNSRCVFQKEKGEYSHEDIGSDEIHGNHKRRDKLKKGRRNTSSEAVDKEKGKKKQQVGNSDGAASKGLMDEAGEASKCVMENSGDLSDESEPLKRKSKRKEENLFSLSIPNDSGKVGSPIHLKESYNVHFVSNRREITEMEKRRASKLAEQYSSTRPSFSIIMKPTHVCRAFKVMIPKRWHEKHMPDSVRRAQLRVPPLEKRWPVDLKSKNGTRWFTGGWSRRME